jgi:hypothetical protein
MEEKGLNIFGFQLRALCSSASPREAHPQPFPRGREPDNSLLLCAPSRLREKQTVDLQCVSKR